MQDGLTDDEIKAKVQNALHRNFDLGAPPCLHCTIAPAGAQRHVVLILIHHILMDGWSFGMIMTDTMAIYQAIMKETQPSLPELPVQYGDYAAWERKQLNDETGSYTDLVTYWKSQLLGATPVIQLPMDYNRLDGGVHRDPVGYSFKFEADRLAAIKQMAAGLKVSLYCVCLTAFRMMLCEFGASDDVIISSSYSIRPPGTEHLVRTCFRSD